MPENNFSSYDEQYIECALFDHLADAYIDGTCTKAQRELIEEHLESCEYCPGALESKLESLAKVRGGLELPAVEEEDELPDTSGAGTA